MALATKPKNSPNRRKAIVTSSRNDEGRQTITTSISFYPDILRKVDSAAASENRTRSNYINAAFAKVFDLPAR